MSYKISPDPSFPKRGIPQKRLRDGVRVKREGLRIIGRISAPSFSAASRSGGSSFEARNSEARKSALRRL